MYARLAAHLADDPSPVETILGGYEGWDAALRLFGAVHYLVLSGAAPDALSGEWREFEAALGEHAAELRGRVRRQGVQTNEVQRCVALLPAFLAVTAETGMPLELLELGPSAGLNLLLDRYRYRYANGSWGPEGAALSLVAHERDGKVPPSLLEQPLDIRGRRGIDLAPVDVATHEGYLLLRSFLWPGLDDRVRRLDAGVATLRTAPVRPELIAGDYVELLPDLLRERPDDAVTVVFQTASTGYLPAEAAERLRKGIAVAGEDGRPLAWVSTRRRDEHSMAAGAVHELAPDHYELELRLWPGPARLAARLDFHGNWLEWCL